MKQSCLLLLFLLVALAAPPLAALGPAAHQGSETVIEMQTRGAFLYGAKGWYVLKVEVERPLTVVIDRAARTYTFPELNGPDHLFYEIPDYAPWKGESPRLQEVQGWKLTPLAKRKPCPLVVSKGRLIYMSPGGKLVGEAIAKYDARLSPNCFEGLDGELIIRTYRPRVVVDGSSDGDSTILEGWDYRIIDASAWDNKWQNTLGLRALKEKDYEKARGHFAQSLKADPSYRHANYNLACTLSLLEVPFAEGKAHLETILADPRQKKTYLRKIDRDPDLAFWRADPAFSAWRAQKHRK